MVKRLSVILFKCFMIPFLRYLLENSAFYSVLIQDARINMRS